MKRLKNILKWYVAIENELDLIIFSILSRKDVQDEIIRLNTEVQLYEEGVDSKNRIIGYYAPYTKEYKQVTGQRYDHITLQDTGYFYKSFRIYLKRDYFIIDADGKKEDKDLFKIYGQDVAGLTKYSIDELRKKIKPYFVEQIRKRINAII